MKRSRAVALVVMGSSPLWLSACSTQQTEEGLYTSVDACAQQTGDYASCQSAFAEAEKAHLETAPRYASRAACVEAHGEDQCVAVQQSGGSVFMPMLAGYMMGRMLSGNRVTGLQSSPAFRNKYGGWERSAPAGERGMYRAGAVNGVTASPIHMQPNQAPTVSRGGFGGNNRRSSGG